MTMEALAKMDLSQMDDEMFRQLVDRDLRSETTPEEAAALRSPEIVDRWVSVITAMSKKVEGHLAAKKQDFEATKSRIKAEINKAEARGSQAIVQKLKLQLEEEKERNAQSRAKTIRFKSGLEESMIEARHIRNTFRPSYDSYIKDERNALAKKVRELEQAIIHHKEEQTEDDTEPSAADIELWSYVK